MLSLKYNKKCPGRLTPVFVNLPHLDANEKKIKALFEKKSWQP